MIKLFKSIILPKSKEVGSDFAFDTTFVTKSTSYYNDYLVLYNGRSCIKLMIDNTTGSYLLPNYLCHSIVDQFSNTSYDYYDIDDQLQIDLEKLSVQLNSGYYKVLYMIDYFGIVDSNINTIKNLCRKNNIIIVEDFTHRPFSLNELYGDITLCSIRKTVAVPLGGIIRGINDYGSHNHYTSYITLYVIKALAMLLKNITWLKCVWRPILVYCENKLDNIDPTCGPDTITNAILSKVDYKAIKKQRLENYNYLREHLCVKTLQTENELYFGYPLVFEDQYTRDLVRKSLIDENIYPAIHWPNSNNNFYQRILSLPIDQRYNIADMERLVKIVNYKSKNNNNYL